MKIKHSFLLLIISLVIITGLSLAEIVKDKDPLKFPKGENYEKEWAQVDSLERLGLPQSALKIVEQIYEKARTENNTDQFIKAVMYRAKLKNYVEEDSFEGFITDMKTEIDKAKYPARPVLHSILADLYWMYYQNNRWKFLQRTTTVGFDPEDIKTWTLNKLAGEVIKHYRLSLKPADSLQRTPVTCFDALIEEGNRPANLRPALYDFLAHRAVSFFSRSELTLTQPADRFELKEGFYFADAREFAGQEIKTGDTLSLHFYAIKILQDILRFRLESDSIDALIDADLVRLNLVHQKSVNELKDSLYLEALKRLERKFSNIPYSSEVSYYIAKHYNTRADKYDPLNETTSRYKNDNKTAYTICKDIIKKFPGTSGMEKCKSLLTEIERKDLSFEIVDVNLPGKVLAAMIRYKSFEKLYMRVNSIDKDDLKKIKEKHYGRELYEVLLKESQVVKQNVIDLPVDEDYNSHSTEYLIDSLPCGQYILILSNNEKFSHKENISVYQMFTVSSISYVNRRNQDGSLDFYVLNRETGEPMSGVSAQAWYSKYNYTLRKYQTIKGGVYTSDDNGYFQIPSGAENTRSFYLEFRKGNDYLNTRNSFYTYRYEEYDPGREYRTYIYTDRAIYRPGQTVYFKGITITTEGKEQRSDIAANYSTKVTFYDVNSQKISELDVTTNEYGTFSGTFNIPTGLLNGRMQIYTPSGSKYISVEEYKRPKFEVKMLPLDGNYLLNDDVEVKGQAIAYAGSNITDAMVTYRIVRTPVWRGWWYYWYYSPDVEIANGKTTTDEKGEYKISFNAVPDLTIPKDNNVSFNYRIYVDVTDINGETQSTEKNITVGYVALQVDINIPEKTDMDAENEFDITTQNLNGEFIPAKGEVIIYKLKEPEEPARERKWVRPDKYIYSEAEWKKLYPGNVYKDENQLLKLEKLEKVYTAQFNTETGRELKMKNLASWKAGRYVAEISSKDAFGNDILNKRFFTAFSQKRTEMPLTAINWFTVIKSEGEPGEFAKFLIGTSEKDVKILYEVEHKGEIVHKEWMALSDRQKLIEVPIVEKYRGNFSVHFVFIKNNRIYKHTEVIKVPYTSKELDIEFETFRNKLYPGQDEEWRIRIKGKKGDKIAAEMMATLYDASLDQFAKNYWNFDIYQRYYTALYLTTSTFSTLTSYTVEQNFHDYYYHTQDQYDMLNWFGFNYYGMYHYRYATKSAGVKMTETTMALEEPEATEMDFGMVEEETDGALMDETVMEGQKMDKGKNGDDEDEELENQIAEKTESGGMPPTKVRTDFKETAFFYPHLTTNEDGEVIIKFTIPESLTRWRMMGMAHTKDLKYGFVENELITQKELMVLPNIPRFFRENDKIVLPAKISNVSEKEITGKATVEFFDAITMKPVSNILNDEKEKEFTIPAKQNAVVKWNLDIPEGLGAVTYRIVAKSDKFSDGEENAVPVLTNRMLVTESLPLPVRGKTTKTFEFKKLKGSGSSKTLRHHKVTLEFTSNPAWYAVQALPYLMEYPYECSEQVFSRYYANKLASHIANSSPKIKRVFDSWKNTPGSEALLSNLEKNQELKSLILEETPWVLNAQNETERKRRVALLFDLNRMANELESAMRKIQKLQAPNGGWPWFKGMPDSRYITQHIVCGFGHLDKLGVQNSGENKKIRSMIEKAVYYLDDRVREDYEYLLEHYKGDELEKNHLGYTQVHYLYTRSFYYDMFEIKKKNKEAFDYYKGQAEKYWLTNSKYMQGMIALALHRFGNQKTPAAIIKSLKEHALHSEEMGMCWKDVIGGYYWYQAPIETQALLIEVFHEVADDKKSVDDMKVWLLKQKQTQDWRTTKATVEAVYALLLEGTDWLATDELVQVKVGTIDVDPKKMDDVQVEAGTGYYKTSWDRGEITPDMGDITVTKTTEGIAWGALYWQYFEQLDKITPHETPLKLNKKLFIERDSDSGKIMEPLEDDTELKVGDKIIVRIELRVDRMMEYVHMKDMRASGFEPINVISRYKYQGGLGYYESTRDAATNFFMGYMPKGTYVFEYPLRVSHSGDFSNGITTIQCMYAPEFTSHSEGIRVKVE